MTNKRSPKRTVDGLLIFNKPPGFSSNQALQKVKWLLNAAKAGHTGSLDPLATGVLPLCFGEATKFSQYLLNADKGYRATFRFGQSSDSGDLDGQILNNRGSGNLKQADIEAVLPRFRGKIEQIPPMYSALKHQGQPLYKLARAGEEVERQPREVSIHRLEVVDCAPRQDAGTTYIEASIEVACSKGTYIRSLAMDMGNVLGCGALVTRLHRTQVGQFHESQAITLAELERERDVGGPGALDHFLLPVEQCITHMQAVQLPEDSGYYFSQGQPVLETAVLKTLKSGELVRVSLGSGKFLGVAEVLADGRIAPRRLVAN